MSSDHRMNLLARPSMRPLGRHPRPAHCARQQDQVLTLHLPRWLEAFVMQAVRCELGI